MSSDGKYFDTYDGMGRKKAPETNYDAPKNPPFSFDINSVIKGMIAAAVDEQFSGLEERASDVIGKQFDALQRDILENEVKKGVMAANSEIISEIRRMFRTDSLVDEIENLPERMLECRQNINDLRTSIRSKAEALSSADQDMKEIEVNLLMDITDEVDINGKKRFSNDKARQAELICRKKEHREYLLKANEAHRLKNEMESLEDAVADDKAKLKSLEAEFQANIKALEAMTAQMNIYAALCGNNVRLPQTPADNSAENNKGAW